MKSHLMAISLLCLSAGLSGFAIGLQTATRDFHDSGMVASEYNPPGRGGTYPGGTRFNEQAIICIDV